jgi:hypothetical protein
MSRVLLVALWIVTLYLSCVVAITAVLLIAPIKMTQDESCVLVAFLGTGDLALIIVALWALVSGCAPATRTELKSDEKRAER